MKRRTGSLLLLKLVAINVTVVGFAPVMAQTVTVLHAFTGRSDGTGPLGGVIASSNTLYGTTEAVPDGFAPNPGSTVFKVNTDGSGFTTLHTFTAGDGSILDSQLLLSGPTLYGTARRGGAWGNGTVFRVNTDGTNFKVLHDFTPTDFTYNADGDGPNGGLVLSGDKLYGTTTWGGSSGAGTIFNVDTNGTSFAVVYNFNRGSDGEGPGAGLILFSNTLYGTTEGYLDGNSYGTVFKVNLDGTGFTTLHTFTAIPPAGSGTNSDGASPADRLVLSGSALYSTTLSGGRWGLGTVFKVNTNGSGFMTLHSFSPTTSGSAAGATDLVLSGNTLYGFGTDGGAGPGVIFQVNTDGSGFADLHRFVPFTGGSASVLVSNTLYGTTWSDGSLGKGTVFSISPIPLIAPLITGQPTGRTNIAGSTCMFSVTATGTAPLFYQWLKETATIAQQTNSSLKLAGVSDADAARYSVVVANAVGSITSNPAMLIVLDGPQITSQPLSRTNIAGSSGSFTVIATGTSPLSYQWFKGTSVIPKQSASTLTLTNVSDADAACYSVVITNQVEKVNSAAAKLTVVDPPIITAQPVSRVIVVGATALFTVVASGTPPLSYEWYKGVNPIPQQASSTLRLVNVSPADAAQYSVVVTNSAGTVRSAPATLTVTDRPWIILTTSGSNAVLMWLTNFTGFILQSTTNLGASTWTAVSPAPAIINEQNTVTNPISGSLQFFRLAR